MTQYNITEQELKGPKRRTKSNIERKVLDEFKKRLINEAQTKSKMNHLLQGKQEWKTGQSTKYMKELTRKQVSNIFKTRTRMIKAKDNYRNGHTDQTCRACKTEAETQDHILQGCKTIHQDETTKVKHEDIFSESTDTLRETANKIGEILEKLENY